MNGDNESDKFEERIGLGAAVLFAVPAMVVIFPIWLLGFLAEKIIGYVWKTE